MRFATLKKEENYFIGVLTNDDRVINISDIFSDMKDSSMVQFIEKYDNSIANKIKNVLAGDISNIAMPLDEVKLCSPIRKPIHDILCVGVNYKDHLEETKNSFNESGFVKPTNTVYFSKRATEIIGQDDTIKSRLDIDDHLDYEVELAVIIGKKCTNVNLLDVEDVIFGYSILNDISSRQLQQKHLQWYRGKSIDTYTSMGPWIVTKDEIPFPVELNVKSTVNGEIRQSSNTKLFLENIPSLISEFSTGITFEPGDIIATGTPSGVGMGYNPPRFMKKGDNVVCEIDRIGYLKNTVE